MHRLNGYKAYVHDISQLRKTHREMKREEQIRFTCKSANFCFVIIYTNAHDSLRCALIKKSCVLSGSNWI